MRGLATLLTLGLLSTTLLASTAVALPDPTRCKGVTDVNCLVNQVCVPGSSDYCSYPGIPIRCDPTGITYCIGEPAVNCYTLGGLSKVVGARLPAGACFDMACQVMDPVTGSCSASEILCQDVTPLYQQVAVPVAGDVGNQLLGLLGGTPGVGPATILKNVLVRAAFYCEPPEGGAGGVGQGCQEVITTGPGRIGLRDFLLHAIAPEGLASVKGLDCAWLASNAAGWLYVATNGWTLNAVDLTAGDSDCQAVVQLGIVEAGIGLGEHAESFRFVYC